MREPGLWTVTAGAGLIAYMVGGGIEQNAITDRDTFGGPAVLVAHGIAVVLGCVAAYQWHRQPRPQAAPNAGLGLPKWQGYGIALLSAAWLALAAATWSLTEIRSPTLTLTMVLAAVAHLVAGTTVLRQHHAPEPDHETSST